MNERILAKLVESINRHIAERSRSLKEMLEEKNPKIRAKDGNEYYVEKDELKFVAKYVDEIDWERFKIPIVLELTEFGRERVAYVRDKLHIEFIRKAFGIDRKVDDALMIYMYELPQIRKKLRTASQILFRVEFKEL
ncbi:MAG: DUF61 family protein [Archaeoglobaceae archaeon]|nr:DUF61 family protein [Archaeoglobaceae archaeon]MCX8152146.1 DUF61 family protein [Archaeoglobaceae archaeon]MDW8013862.1 DUF61 family protein [Archaeoglobaceae archaeon]